MDGYGRTKWCDKNTMAEEIAARRVMLSGTDVREYFRSLREIDGDVVMSVGAPMLVDEWSAWRRS